MSHSAISLWLSARVIKVWHGWCQLCPCRVWCAVGCRAGLGAALSCTMSTDACVVVVICSQPVCTCCSPFLHPACVVLQPVCVGSSLGCVLCPCVLGIPSLQSQQECVVSRALQCVFHSSQQVCMDVVGCVVVVVVVVACVQTMPALRWPAQHQQEPQQGTRHSPCVSSTTPFDDCTLCAGGVAVLTACKRITSALMCNAGCW